MTHEDISPTMRDGADAGDFVQSLARGLAVIRAFGGDHPLLSLSDVARRADLSRASARRFLHTLQSLGYVRTDGRAFALTPRVLELGFSYISGLSLPEVAQPHLDALSARLGESVSIAVLDDAEVVYVARAESRRIMSVRITVGTRFPALATSLGRVMLSQMPADEVDAHLREWAAASRGADPADIPRLQEAIDLARDRGWTIVDGELEPGIRSVAVPLRNGQGETIAAMNIATDPSRATIADMERVYLLQLLESAALVEDDLRAV